MKTGNKKRRIKRELEWYSFLIISIITLIVLTYIPTLTTIKYSFYDTRTLGYGGSFNGMTNYKVLVMNDTFLRALFNTFSLAILSLLQIPVGFILATLINNLGKGKTQSFFRIGYYLPNIITGVSVVLIFQVVLKENGGLLNQGLSLLTGQDLTVGWLTDSKYSHFGATILSLWQNTGYAVLICLANLQSISKEIYEAAEVDGATGFKQWIYITIPHMKSCFSFLFITTIITGLARFTDLFIIGGNTASGRPGGSLQTLLMYIYQYSFEYPQFGLASAGAMILFVITFAVTLINLRATGFLRKKGD